jgi:YD repeat-containing protein
MASRKKQIEKLTAVNEPTVVVGSHLTTITHPNGHIELVWDDAKLLKDVQDAIASIEHTAPKIKKTKIQKAPK